MHIVHVFVACEGEGSLGQLAVLVGENLLLMIQRVVDVRVEVLLLLHHSVQVLLVVDLAAVGVNGLLECGVLLVELA